MRILLILGFIIAVLASNSLLNDKYSDVLHGQTPLDLLIGKEIYEKFVSTYPVKDDYRYLVFVENLKEMIRHNKQRLSWEMGLNDFADMTWEEFSQLKLMAPQNCSATEYNLKAAKSKVTIPDAYEWNNYGVVTPVKDQGNCGSCWTFSTVGSLESHWNILGKGTNVIFSEQQLVDCAGAFDNHGCNGGLPSHAFEYIRYSQGIETNRTYPYTGKDGKCAYRPSIAVGYIGYGSYNITAGDEHELADRLFNAGPISIAYDCAVDFRFYKSGVYTSRICRSGAKNVNHAVVATGYGHESGLDFWNVKNSWGPTWGVNGYFKIERGKNMCGVAECNSYPLIDSPQMSGLKGSRKSLRA